MHSNVAKDRACGPRPKHRGVLGIVFLKTFDITIIDYNNRGQNYPARKFLLRDLHIVRSRIKLPDDEKCWLLTSQHAHRSGLI